MECIKEDAGIGTQESDTCGKTVPFQVYLVKGRGIWGRGSSHKQRRRLKLEESAEQPQAAGAGAAERKGQGHLVRWREPESPLLSCSQLRVT